MALAVGSPDASQSGPHVVLPAQACMRGTSVASEPYGISPTSVSSASESGPTNAYQTQMRPNPACASTLPKFFELCINTGEFAKSHGEIDVTRVTNDTTLFAKIHAKYCDIRGHRIKKHYFLKPRSMQFVQFIVECGREVSIVKKHCYPSKQDVEGKKYHYSPCPIEPYPPMPSEAFMHKMKCARRAYKSGNVPPARSFWLDRLPKKLQGPVSRSSEPQSMEWGVHILEGPDYVNMYFTLICTLSACLALVAVYTVKTRDVAGAAGIGSMLVAALTLLWMAMKVEGWRQED